MNDLTIKNEHFRKTLNWVSIRLKKKLEPLEMYFILRALHESSKVETSKLRRKLQRLDSRELEKIYLTVVGMLMWEHRLQECKTSYEQQLSYCLKKFTKIQHFKSFWIEISS